jgi:hypothetical protein
MKNEFSLLDQESAVDLQSFLTRAKKLDPDGLVRLRAFGDVLACYVAPIFSGSIIEGGPTILGLRTMQIAGDAELDALVPIAAVLDRLATIADNERWRARDSKIVLPDSVRSAWAGISPPRAGWVQVGSVNETVLTQIAKDGIQEVAESLPTSVGGPIAARIRGEIWGRAMTYDSSVPMGAAFVAAGLGFLTENEEVGVFETQGWVRLSSEHGHVVARAAITAQNL